MSLKTEINKKLSGDCNQKTLIIEEFDRLFEINKNFISNDKSTKPIPKPSTSQKSSANEFLKKKCDSQKCSPICPALSLPAGKDHRIGNFNIYNKCIFLVNNDENLHTKRSIKSKNVISHNHSVTEDKTYSKLVTNKNTSKISFNKQNESLVTNNNDIITSPSETNKCLELYTAVDNELKRIETPLGSSGVYKKVPMNGEEVFDAKPVESKSNVYYSSTESQGKIIPDHVFSNTYVLLDNDIDEPLATAKAKPSTDENNFNVVLTDKSSAKDSLNILAYDILKLSNSDDFVIDRKKQEIIFREPKLNKKTIYRMIKPESLGLTKKIFDTIDPVKDKANVQSLLKPSVLNKKRGRPRKLEDKQATIDKNQKNAMTDLKNHAPLTINPVPIVTTRFGRTTKRPIYIPTLSPVKNVSKELGSQRLLHSIVVDLKDPDYKYNKPLPIPVQEQSPKLDEPPIKRERNLPPEYVCPTCGKVFLGRRMQRHYVSHPDHQKQTSEASSQPPTSEDISLYKFLLKKVNQVSESNDKKVEVFLKEISDFVSQLQSRASNLIYNTSELHMHYINTQTSKVLGVPTGHYALDLNALNSASETTPHSEDPIRSLAPPQSRLDYNLSMSLDDTLTETKLNLSDNHIPSEESLLRTVDDLVKEGIKKLTQNHCDSSMDNNHHQHTINPQVIHYDHASDNAVEAVSMKETPPPILDLSLDLFQFNSN